MLSPNFLEKIETIKKLPDNWDGQYAPKVDNILMDISLHTVKTILSVYKLNEPDIGINFDGGIDLDWNTHQLCTFYEENGLVIIYKKEAMGPSARLAPIVKTFPYENMENIQDECVNIIIIYLKLLELI